MADGQCLSFRVSLEGLWPVHFWSPCESHVLCNRLVWTLSGESTQEMCAVAAAALLPPALGEGLLRARSRADLLPVSSLSVSKPPRKQRYLPIAQVK